MKVKQISCLLLCLLMGFLNNCARSPSDSENLLHIRELTSPAAEGSGQPNLFTANDGRIYLSWIKATRETRHALRYSFHDGERWSEPKTIAEGEKWFVNWADFPSLITVHDGWMAAHWLAKSGEGTYAYDVNLAQSEDEGHSWSDVVVPHTDGTQTEHGFVSMLPWSTDRLFVSWLDGRNFEKRADDHGSATNEMSLRFAILDKSGQIRDSGVLDPRVCECCQTSAALTRDGVIVAYRDRTQGEIRDISVVRWQKDGWTDPLTVYDDNWNFLGCPVNGPSVAASGNAVVVAWFTAANDSPRVKLAFSEDGGRTFGPPIQVNDGETVGRVDAVLLDDGSALVSWMESTEGGGEIKVRRVRGDGSRNPVSTLARISTGRASGFPQMEKSGNQIYFAWTEVGDPATIKTATALLSDDR